MRGNCSLFDVEDVMISPILWSVVVFGAYLPPLARLTLNPLCLSGAAGDRMELVIRGPAGHEGLQGVRPKDDKAVS